MSGNVISLSSRQPVSRSGESGCFWKAEDVDLALLRQLQTFVSSRAALIFDSPDKDIIDLVGPRHESRFTVVSAVRSFKNTKDAVLAELIEGLSNPRTSEAVSLVDDDEFEEQIELMRLENEAAQVLRRPMLDFEARLDALRDQGCTVDARRYSPATLMLSWNLVIKERPYSALLGSALNQMFRKKVLNTMVAFYARATSYLALMMAENPVPSEGKVVSSATPLKLSHTPKDSEFLNQVDEALSGEGEYKLPIRKLIAVSRVIDPFLASEAGSAGALLQIGRVRPAVFRAALADPAFFSDPNSALRALLRDLLMKGISSAGSERTRSESQPVLDQMARQIVALAPIEVGEMVEGGDLDDIGVDQFIASMPSISDLESEHDYIQRIRRLSRTAVASRLASAGLSAEKNMPIVTTFTSMLSVAYFTHHGKSGAWEDCLYLLDRVIVCATPSLAPNDFMESVNETAAVMSAITDHVESVTMPEDRRSKLLVDIMQIVDPVTAPVQTRFDNSLKSQSPQAVLTESAKAFNRASSLMPILLLSNSYYRLVGDDGKPRYLRLKDYSPSTPQLRFLNYKGEAVVSIKPEDFLSDLCKGKASYVRDDVAFNDALQQARQFLVPDGV